jgi:RNA polymerase sigma-70 factor (ECF subfamily)
LNAPLHTGVLETRSIDSHLQNAEPNDEVVVWVRRALQGEQDAYTWIAEKYQGRLRLLLERRLGNHCFDAEDAVQETLARAFRSLNRYETRYRFSTWIFTIGLRVASDMLRARKRRPSAISTEDIAAEIEDRSSDSCSKNGFSSSDLWAQAKRFLSETQSTALWLRYAEDMSVGEIAVAMRKTQVGVRVLLHRARVQLMQQMDRQPGQDANNDHWSHGT